MHLGLIQKGLDALERHKALDGPSYLVREEEQWHRQSVEQGEGREGQVGRHGFACQSESSEGCSLGQDRHLPQQAVVVNQMTNAICQTFMLVLLPRGLVNSAINGCRMLCIDSINDQNLKRLQVPCQCSHGCHGCSLMGQVYIIASLKAMQLPWMTRISVQLNLQNNL